MWDKPYSIYPIQPFYSNLLISKKTLSNAIPQNKKTTQYPPVTNPPPYPFYRSVKTCKSSTNPTNLSKNPPHLPFFHPLYFRQCRIHPYPAHVSTRRVYSIMSELICQAYRAMRGGGKCRAEVSGSTAWQDVQPVLENRANSRTTT